MRTREIGQINTHGVVKDEAGFIWIGANNGLLRYDGSDVRVFKFADKDIDLNRTAWTTAVAIDPDGNIWSATRLGLARLSPQRKSLRFESAFNNSFQSVNGVAVASIVVDENQQIWTVTNGGVYRYNYRTGEVVQEIKFIKKCGRPIRILRQSNGTIWVIYRRGIIAIKKKGDSAFRFENLADYPGVDGPSLSTSATLLDSDDRIYMATRSGLFLVDVTAKSAKEIKSTQPHLELKGRARIRALCLDDDHPGKIWVGTVRQGLALLDMKSGKSTIFTNDRQNSADLMSDNIYSIQKDRCGSLWIGCSVGYSIMNTPIGFELETFEEMGGGTLRQGRPAIAFTTNDKIWVSLPDNHVICRDPNGRQRSLKTWAATRRASHMRQSMLAGKNGDVWISILNHGLVHVDRDYNESTLIASKSESGLLSNKIEDMCWVSDGEIIVGHDQGLQIYSLAAKTFRNITIDPKDDSPQQAMIRFIDISKSGTVFASTYDDRLIILPRGSKTAESISFGRDGPRNRPQNITSFTYDGKRGLWITAFNGIFHWDALSKKVERIEILDQFARVGRNGIIVDDMGKLWLAGLSNTLVCFTPEEKSFRYVELEDNIGRFNFLPAKHIKAPDGKLHFLCREGVLSFDPSKFRAAATPRQPIITGLEVLGKEQWEGREFVGASRVEINESDHFVTLRFVSPNGEPNDLLTYSYRLTGVRSDWIDIGTRKAIDFSNLPAGEFDFEVKATYNATGASAISSPVTLVVTPPLLAQPKIRFAIALGIILLGGLFAFLRFRIVAKQTKVLQTEIDGRSRAEAALVQSEARLATAFDSMPCATWVRSKDGTVTMANPLFLETWGNIIGQQSPADSMPVVYAEHWTKDHATALLGTTVQETLDYGMGDAICRVIHVVSPIVIKGRVAGTVGVDVDISALRQSEIERNQLEKQLRHTQKLEAIGKLAGGVAHDFNNILTAITGHAELMKHGIEDGLEVEQLKSNLDGVLNSSGRAARLTQQLLTFTKRGIVVPEIFDPEPVLNEMKSMMSRLIRTNIELTMDCEENIGLIRADRAQFEQIILNLLVNSSDAMPDGGKLSISLYSCQTSGDSKNPHKRALGLRVIDTGTGMSEDIQNRVYEPYFSTKPAGEGTGLGLSTVHGIVDGLGGTISLSSKVGEGTQIDVILPCVVTDSTAATEPNFATAKSLPRGRETIVVCEDNQPVRRVTCSLLTFHGYNVIETRTPEEALEVFANAKVTPPMLITDVVMPNMDGPQLVKKLLLDFPQLKVLFMSGYASDSLKSSELKRKNVGFLNKPFTATTLMEQTKLLLEANDQETRTSEQEQP